MVRSKEDAAADFAATNALNRNMATAVVMFHEAASRRLGMTAADRKCLGVLAEMGTATPGQIARATGLTTGAITGIVDRLEKLGYAKRAPSPTDRRSVIVHALRREELAAVMNPIFASLTAAMDALYERYTPEQLALIQSYLADTTETLQAETRKIEDSRRAST